MNARLTGSAFVLLALCCAAVPCRSDAAQGTKAYRKTINDHMAALSTGTYSLERTRDVLDSLEGQRRYRARAAVEPWADLRREEATLVCRLLVNAQRQLDPDFDPNDVPQLSVPAPEGSGFSGAVDPGQIKDEALRREYVERLRANEAKAERYRQQHQLRVRYEQILDDAREYLVDIYALPPGRVSELQTLLAREGWSAQSIAEVVAQVRAKTSEKGRR